MVIYEVLLLGLLFSEGSLAIIRSDVTSMRREKLIDVKGNVRHATSSTVESQQAALAERRHYKCTAGHGFGFHVIKTTRHNDVKKCGHQCDGLMGCIAFDWTNIASPNACRLFVIRKRKTTTGPGSRRYCELFRKDEPRDAPYQAIECLPRSQKHAVALSNDAKIPPVVFMTGPWETVPQKLLATLSHNCEHMPYGTTYRYFNNEQMTKSTAATSRELRKIGIDGARSAFNALRPGAFRADLWRYLTLWQHGGMYLDVKIVMRSPMQSWVNFYNDSLALVEDVGLRSNTGRLQGYWNAMMAAAPRNWVLGKVIEHVVHNVQSRSYGTEDAPVNCSILEVCQNAVEALAITGPAAFARGVELALDAASNDGGSSALQVSDLAPTVRASTRKWKIKDLNDSHIVSEGTVVFLTNPSHEQEIAVVDEGLRKTLHRISKPYAKWWKERAVYCDERGTPCEWIF